MPELKDRALLRGMLVVALGGVAIALYATIGVVSGPSTSPAAPGEPAATGGGGTSADPPALPPVLVDDPSVSGVLLDSAGAPIAGATITALEELAAPPRDAPDAGPSGGIVIGSRSASTQTNADGRFAIANLPDGPHRLRVEGDGVVTAEVRFITLPALDLEIAAQREIAIGGRVAVPDGAVIDPAHPLEVHVRGETEDRRVRPDADGAFRFESLPEGVYRVWADAGTLGAPAVRVEARGAGPFADVELALTAAIITRGVLLDGGTGRPVAGRVVLTHDGDQPEHRAEVGADGRFAIGGLLPGRWYADASAAGYVPAEQLAFEADRSRELELRVSRGGTIEGVAVDPDGDPVAGALVEAVPRDRDQATSKPGALRVSAPAPLAGGQRFVPRGELGVLLGPIPFPPAVPAKAPRVAQPIADPASAVLATGSGQRLSDDAGRFVIAGLRAGVYQLKASHPDLAGGVSAPLKVELGRALTGAKVVLKRGVRVRGVVADESDQPLPGATVTATVTGDPPLTAITDSRGAYALPPILGSASIEASAAGHASATKPIPVAADGSELTIGFRLARADKRIEGRVRDSGGFPVRGARVALARTPALAAISDESGRFELTGLAAGSHDLVVTHNDFPDLATALQTGSGAELTLALGGGISGEVRDERTLSRIPGATIELKAGKNPPIVVRADDSGGFRVVPIAAGAWTVKVVAPAYATTTMTLEVPAADRPGRVTRRDVVLELARGATLAGTVRDENGERVVGATVSVVSGSGTAVKTVTDIDGRFSLIDVPARGETTLRIVAGDRAGVETIELAPGDERRTLELRVK